MNDLSTVVGGIDTGKAFLDIALWPGGELHRLPNDPQGWARLAEWLHANGATLVGIEASGGYERGVIAALRSGGLAVACHQPAEVRLFARLRRIRAKNDRIDAQVIAAFTADHIGQVRTDPGRNEAFADHLVYIEQTIQDLARLKTRLEHCTDSRLRALMEADIRALRRRIASERRLLEAALRRDEQLSRRLDLVLSIPGIGLPTALALVIDMPELGRLSREQAAALIGLAPYDRDSGKKHGQRHIGGGRSRPRKALYAAALPAAFRWNPALQSFYQRLIARGKAHKQALTACARKLIVFVNTVLARNTPWTQS